MNPKIVIRDETQADVSAIAAVPENETTGKAAEQKTAST